MIAYFVLFSPSFLSQGTSRDPIDEVFFVIISIWIEAFLYSLLSFLSSYDFPDNEPINLNRNQTIVG